MNIRYSSFKTSEEFEFGEITGVKLTELDRNYNVERIVNINNHKVHHLKPIFADQFQQIFFLQLEEVSIHVRSLETKSDSGTLIELTLQ